MLDHSTDVRKLHPSIMSIRRKWVSDTNLSKLLHETIEKKQANKQSKLPDFCKDAILSATIKRISSAMLVHGKLPCSDSKDDSEESSQGCDHNLGAETLSNTGIVDKTWEDDSDIAMSLDNIELEDMDSEGLKISLPKSSQWQTVHPPLERQQACNSPKRKRQPSCEIMDDSLSFTNLETIVPHASPRKKRRAEFLKSKSMQTASNFTIDDDDDNDWLRDGTKTVDLQHNTHNYGMHAQRSQSLPHLTFFSKEDLIIPQKNSSSSVVSSISELSIHDCLESSGDSSWCFTNEDTTVSDPLELNGFFQELSTVTVNPN